MQFTKYVQRLDSLIFSLLITLCVTGIRAQDTTGGFHFTDLVNIEHTGVKNQGMTGTCWSFSGNSFIETEMNRMGRPFVDIADMFTVRNTYLEKADRYVRMHGKLNFGQGGALPDAFAMMKKYGALPELIYPGKVYDEKLRRHGELESVLKGMLDAVIANKDKHLSHKWKEAYRKVVDTYLGEVPETFMFHGKSYTPKSFAKQVVGLNPDDYIQFSSTSRVPFHRAYIILVPDNWMMASSYNVPVEEMTQIVDHALRKGFSVAWAADVSEPYFSWKKGMAILPPKSWADMTAEERQAFFDKPGPEMTVTQKMRDEQYDDFRTTDDHGMHIVGLAKDQNGKEYYIVKNSWDVNNPYQGYLYVSKPYFTLKTTAFMLHKDGIPSEIKGKLHQ